MNKVELNNFEIKKQNIGLVVYLARKSLSYNHMDLVGITGLTRPIISTIEKSKANTTLESLIKLKSALALSDEIFLMNEEKFWKYKTLLKINFANYQSTNSKLHIPQEYWNQLLKLSDEETKSSYAKIVKLCRLIVETNSKSQSDIMIQNSTVGAALGVIYQQDGFEDNLNFGAWFGKAFLT